VAQGVVAHDGVRGQHDVGAAAGARRQRSHQVVRGLAELLLVLVVRHGAPRARVSRR